MEQKEAGGGNEQSLINRYWVSVLQNEEFYESMIQAVE